MRLEPELTDSLQRLMAQTDTDKYKLLAVLMASTGFYDTTEEQPPLPSTLKEYDSLAAYYEAEYPEELALLQSSYETILSDIIYFPVMKSSRNKETGFCGADISYADAWLAERNYQNTSHSHEGTDIMALNNRRGYYPIVSMTDGVVENIGWLEKGGYRIGIRSPHGGYFYYAHLYRYADGLTEGSQIQAGQLLGFMGDSGYSKVEGTVGNFDVHLHLGIYLKTSHYEELSVNPYWILKLVESSTVVGDY
ncbi:MAG: M23 family metallopeptidase [Lachnospiraceae bacterium]|nr:M23 family metallopeptidase [Lachnospiraceae bacterium]